MEASTAKAISMLTLGLGSFITGMLPACFSESTRQRHPLFISSLLCFGAGVLLSTSLTHMLPEAREKLPDYSELMFCVGFFLVYLVDEIVHLFYQPSNGHQERRSYGSSEETGLLRSQRDLRVDGEIRDKCCGDADNPRMCHVSHTEPCNKSSSGVVGLLCALFVHSFLEGLAIGLQESASQVLLLLGAVCSHKFVVGFCLGAELLASAPGRICAHIVCVALFSGGSVAGIGAGAGLETVSTLKDSIAVPIMQMSLLSGPLAICWALGLDDILEKSEMALRLFVENEPVPLNFMELRFKALAAGTLLYVTVSEVLPRERARWHERKRSAGVAQFFATCVGFAVMYLLTVYLDHDA